MLLSLLPGGIHLKRQLKQIENNLKNIKKIELFFIVIFISVFLACLTYLIGCSSNAYSNRQEMEKLSPINSIAETVSSAAQSLVQNDKKKKESISEKLSVLPQFQKLYGQNPDIFGWVSIDGTDINYPVMFTPDDAEYYLHRNFQKKSENRGLPFLDGNTDIDKSSNYLIYGHSMKDGTEFANLLDYSSKSYFQKHPIIHFNTIYQTGDYKIIGVLLSKVYNQNEDVFKYYKFSYPATDGQYESFVANVKKISLYDTGVTASPGEQLLTLSTCSYHTQDGRLAVVAKRIS